MQKELIGAMNSVVTESIKQEIGNSWYTIKVDDTKDPAGVENIFMIISFFYENSLKSRNVCWFYQAPLRVMRNQLLT